MEKRDHQAKGIFSSTLQNRLTAYSTLAVAGACAAAATPDNAQAAVVYSGPLNLSVTVSTLGSYFNLANFTFGANYAAVNGGDTTAPAINLWGTGSTFTYLYPSASTINRFVSTGTAQTDLSAGDMIASTSTYGTSRAPSALGTAGGWTANTTGYLGIRFLSGTTTDYGWLQIFYPGTPTAANPIKILGSAYDNSGASITAGQVPEPGTVAFLAAGALGAGTMAWRRRKAA